MDRGRGFYRGHRGRSGGRQFPHSDAQTHRRYNHGRGSYGRGKNQIWVEKSKDGQSSLEPMSGVGLESKSLNPSDPALEELESKSLNPSDPALEELESKSLNPSDPAREELESKSLNLSDQAREELESKSLNASDPAREELESKSSKASDPAREETNAPPLSSSPVPMSEGRAQTSQILADSASENETSRCDFSTVEIDKSCKQVGTSRPFVHGGKSFGPSQMRDSKALESDGKSENSEHSEVFDIYRLKSGIPKLNRPLHEINKERRNAIQEVRTDNVLRPGMVLLKSYIPLKEQVEIAKRCRDLGIGRGGFYQPGYDGAKLHLKMMCLGKNWDPETGNYGDLRPSDGTRPPAIPPEFSQLVKIAIKDAHSAIERESNDGNAAKLLPWMTPDICITNFYSTTGRLGLHQDRDESRDSIRMGLPVVSFSIGDSAVFLYGDQRDIDKADEVVLASGDVLIFGGQSRSIFHGVTAIQPNTAPKALLELVDLRPGRLNLTFRQY